MLTAAKLQKIFYINKQNNKIMAKKSIYWDYLQRTIIETLTPTVYCRITSLFKDGVTIYMVECLFKFTHRYKRIVRDDFEDALTFYNLMIK